MGELLYVYAARSLSLSRERARSRSQSNSRDPRYPIRSDLASRISAWRGSLPSSNSRSVSKASWRSSCYVFHYASLYVSITRTHRFIHSFIRSSSISHKHDRNVPLASGPMNECQSIDRPEYSFSSAWHHISCFDQRS